MMRLLRAGAIVTVILSVLSTIALTWFGQSYAGYDLSATITRVLFWGTVTLIAAAPLCLVVFPIMHLLLGGGEPVKPKSFAIVGAVVGFLIAAYLVWRFRAFLLQASFVAGPFLVLIGVVTGFVGGFLFERLARRRLDPPTV